MPVGDGPPAAVDVSGTRLVDVRPVIEHEPVASNGDIYEDTLGPGYAVLERYWAEPTEANFAPIRSAISREGFRDEILNGAGPRAEPIPPELWELHWALMTDERIELASALIAGLRENLS